MAADARSDVRQPRVVLGVAGGIAAYKSADLLRRLTESGHDVRVVPTASALRFVGAPTWAALSGHPVATDVWDDVHEVPHVRIGQEADLVLVAPATANLLARAAHGLADDLLTNVLLTARCPVVMAPGDAHRDVGARRHAGQRRDAAPSRRDRPRARGRTAHRSRHRQGPAARARRARRGRPPRPRPRRVARLLPDLTGRRLVVSAGGTREPVDPVRFLGNRSSGRQGYALAATAAARGADVVLVAANVALPDPAGVKVVPVGTAAELHDAVLGPLARRRRRRHGRGRRRLPAHRGRQRQAQEGQAPRSRPRSRSSAPPTCSASWSPAASRGPGGRRLRRRDRRRDGRRARTTAGPSSRPRAATCSSSTTSTPAERSSRPRTPPWSSAADGGETVVPRGPKEALADVVWDLVRARWEPRGRGVWLDSPVCALPHSRRSDDAVRPCRGTAPALPS